MGPRRYLSLIALGLVLGSGLYFGIFRSTEESPRPPQETRQEPSDQVLSDFELNETIDRSEAWILKAPNAIRRGDTVLLDSPFVVQRVDGDTKVTIKSRIGLYLLNEKLLILKNDVRLKRVQQNQVLKTNRLKWDRKDQMVRTNSAVTLRMPRGTLRARGMETNLEEETIRFLSNVRYLSK